MDLPLFTNNAKGVLFAGITEESTTVQLGAGEGAKFPQPGTDEYFPITLFLFDGNGNETVWEVLKCTNVSTDTLTVERGANALDWPPGTPVELRLTAEEANLFSNTVGVAATALQPEDQLTVQRTGVLIQLLESLDNSAVQLRFKSDDINRRFIALNSANEVQTQIVFGAELVSFYGSSATRVLFEADLTSLRVPNDLALTKNGGTVSLKTAAGVAKVLTADDVEKLHNLRLPNTVLLSSNGSVDVSHFYQDVIFTGSADIVYTVTSRTIAVGTRIYFLKNSTGSVNFSCGTESIYTPGEGTVYTTHSINGVIGGAFTLNNRYERAILTKLAEYEWSLTGDVSEYTP